MIERPELAKSAKIATHNELRNIRVLIGVDQLDEKKPSSELVARRNRLMGMQAVLNPDANDEWIHMMSLETRQVLAGVHDAISFLNGQSGTETEGFVQNMLGGAING